MSMVQGSMRHDMEWQAHNVCFNAEAAAAVPVYLLVGDSESGLVYELTAHCPLQSQLIASVCISVPDEAIILARYKLLKYLNLMKL